MNRVVKGVEGVNEKEEKKGGGAKEVVSSGVEEKGAGAGTRMMGSGGCGRSTVTESWECSVTVLRP